MLELNYIIIPPSTYIAVDRWNYRIKKLEKNKLKKNMMKKNKKKMKVQSIGYLRRTAYTHLLNCST